jgi:uridylate kinase
MQIKNINRLLLKISGEMLSGTQDFGLDPKALEKYAKKIKDVYDRGVEIGVVIGGGNIFRGLSVAAKGMDRVAGDYLGMLATIMNSVALQSSLEKLGCDTRVMSAITITQLAEPYIRRKASRHLDKGRIVIMAGGTGNPYFTTDTAAVLRGIEINADVIMKGTKVDGVYDKDPKEYSNAVRYEKLTYKQVIDSELKIMDMTAVTLCKENNFPILVFDLESENSIINALDSSKYATIIS